MIQVIIEHLQISMYEVDSKGDLFRPQGTSSPLPFTVEESDFSIDYDAIDDVQVLVL